MQSTITADRLEALAQTMDDGLRETLHDRLSPCSPVEFLAAYCEASPAWAAAAELSADERAELCAKFTPTAEAAR